MPGRIAGKYNPTATAEINRRTQQYAARTGAMPSPQQISQLEAAAVNKGNWIEDALAVSLTDRRAMIRDYEVSPQQLLSQGVALNSYPFVEMGYLPPYHPYENSRYRLV